jgi:hypothetical protein
MAQQKLDPTSVATPAEYKLEKFSGVMDEVEEAKKGPSLNKEYDGEGKTFLFH